MRHIKDAWNGPAMDGSNRQCLRCVFEYGKLAKFRTFRWSRKLWKAFVNFRVHRRFEMDFKGLRGAGRATRRERHTNRVA